MLPKAKKNVFLKMTEPLLPLDAVWTPAKSTAFALQELEIDAPNRAVFSAPPKPKP